MQNEQPDWAEKEAREFFEQNDLMGDPRDIKDLRADIDDVLALAVLLRRVVKEHSHE